MKNRIQEIVDETLARMQADNALIGPSSLIPAEMLDNESPDSGKWNPIPSIVTDEDLDRLEGKIGLKLPPSFRTFLQYKHFDTLYLRDHTIWLPPHYPDHDLQQFQDRMVHGWDESILAGGYISFADFVDSGFLCFDTNFPQEYNEWKVVYIDHENLEVAHDYAENFLALLEGDEETSFRCIDKLNAYNGYPTVE
ncbi:MAG: SMI1/KNR4 family protein [Bacteroidetes bacterium]|nr:SMI1/KNR4 family protein [Bacteroidota bacterium]